MNFKKVVFMFLGFYVRTTLCSFMSFRSPFFCHVELHSSLSAENFVVCLIIVISIFHLTHLPFTTFIKQNFQHLLTIEKYSPANIVFLSFICPKQVLKSETNENCLRTSRTYTEYIRWYSVRMRLSARLHTFSSQSKQVQSPNNNCCSFISDSLSARAMAKF